MADKRVLPDDPLAFITGCVRREHILWTYHVNMRLQNRHIPRQTLLGAVDTYEIIEAYAEDKYLPSYLIRAVAGDSCFHVLFAVDVLGECVHVVTAYRPSPDQWDHEYRRRHTP